MTDEMIGREIGRYKILELIGEGGMATVYKAYDTRLEREVAIKVIRREVFSPTEMEMLLKRFEREAKSLGRLSHPNIVPVIDYGEFEGAPYLVMVYLPGGTLKDRLGKPIPWRSAVQMLLPIAHALQYVHAQNIINRDIKPSNILLTENGEPMLTDFGLVKVYGDRMGATLITSTGAGLGTPDYMAPEQWIGETTAKSDMYSLGVVLYEMITGHRPYKADTPAGVLLKQANEPLPLPTVYIQDLPTDAESVLLKVLAKDPENRYAEIDVFVSDLERLLSGEKVTASAINVEKLRAQMTGTVEIQPEPIPTPTPVPLATDVTPTPQPSFPSPMPATPVATPRKRNITLPVFLLMVFAGAMLIVGIAGCWFLYNNRDFLYFSFGPTPVQVSQVAAASPTTQPSPTTPPPTATETEEATPEPTETSTPTKVPLKEEIKDNQGIPMRLVPTGEFTMGSDDSPDVASRSAHTVTLEAFYIDKYEVTNAMYAKCDAPECRDPKNPGSLTRSVYYRNPNFANYPVIYVDWWMARAYCAWRDARLPTEAEWEKAARGTDERIYPWASQERNCFYSNLAGCEGDTSPVDKFEQGKSLYGVYDLSGNVWEWTSSLFMAYPYDPDDGRESLTANGTRVLRGGSFHSFGVPSGAARNDTRFEMDPTYYGAYVGFRCARGAETE